MSGKCPYEKVSLPGFNNIYIAKRGVSHTMNGYNSVCSGKVSVPYLVILEATLSFLTVLSLIFMSSWKMTQQPQAQTQAQHLLSPVRVQM